MEKPFIVVGPLTININAIAFIKQVPTGALQSTTTLIKKEGGPYRFAVPAGDRAEELMRRLQPYVAVSLKDVSVPGIDVPISEEE